MTHCQAPQNFHDMSQVFLHKTIKSTYLYYKRCWNCSPCTCTNSLCRLHMSKFISWMKCLTEFQHRLFWEETLVNFTTINWLQKPVSEINTTSRVTSLQSMNKSHLVLSKFMQLLRYGCWRYRDVCLLCRWLNDFCGMCSNPTHISSSASSVNTLPFLAGFLSRDEQILLTF
jgi:hypothetical protein